MARAMEAEPYTQARVRVNEEGSVELLEALDRHVDWLLDVRDAVTHKDERKELNRRVTATRRVLKEAERTATEQGWSHGQSQRPDS